jgi:MoaA/NifB/PqqE/SkfB family radical SAM enzyme
MIFEKELILRLSKWLKGEKANPYMITLRPTWKCNLQCRGCIIPTVQNKKLHEISTLDFLKIIDEAAKLGVRRIEIVGEGEPLQKPGIYQIMQRIKYHNIRGTMTTNCTLFTEEKIKSVIEMGFDLIAVSLDGPDAKTHDYIRGVKGTFSKVIKNLKMFNKYKEKMKKDKPEIMLVPFLNKVNYNLIEEMIILAKRLKVKSVHFKPLILNEKSEELKFTDEELKELSTCAEKAYKTAKEIGVETNVEIFINKNVAKNQTDIQNMIKLGKKIEIPFSITCLRPFYHIDISPDGTAFLCHYKLFENENDKQNVCNTNLKEIWFGEKARKFRNRIKSGEIPKICKYCCGGNILEDWALKSQLANFLSSSNN